MRPRVVKTVEGVPPCLVHSIEGFTSGSGSVHDCRSAAAVEKGSPLVLESAVRVEPIELREERWELLREAKWWLGEWEAHRSPDAKAELLAALEKLARLVV